MTALRSEFQRSWKHMDNKNNIVKILGAAFWLLSAVINPWFLRRVFSFDDVLTNRPAQILYLMLSLMLILVGLVTVVFSGSILKYSKELLLVAASIALATIIVY